MKQALSLLTVFVFLQTQTWALSGGPVFPTGSPNLAGSYSGAMAEKSRKFGTEYDDPNSGTTPNLDEPAGSTGIYTVTIPASGLATGNAVIFINGTLYASIGITGVADPDKSTFDGILSGTQPFLDPNNVTINVLARGYMKTKIKERAGVPLPGRTDTTRGIAARMNGKATIDAFVFTAGNLTPIPLVKVEYSVSGYRSTTTALP